MKGGASQKMNVLHQFVLGQRLVIPDGLDSRKCNKRNDEPQGCNKGCIPEGGHHNDNCQEA